MNKLKTQFATVSELLFSGETRQTYAQAFSLTGSIIKETLTLFWMVFCLVFLIFVWGWQYAQQIGRNVKVWYHNQERHDSEHLFQQFSHAFLEAGTSGTTFAITQAKEQLGIQNDPKPIPAIQPIATVQAETISEPQTATATATATEAPPKPPATSTPSEASDDAE